MNELAEETKRQETDYTILRQGDGALDWIEQRDVLAANAAQAIRRYVEGAPDEWKAGIYIAVPARQFQPRTVAIETKQVVKFAEETDPEETTEPPPAEPQIITDPIA